MTLPVARITDKLSDTDTIVTGSGDVFVNNLPVSTITSLTAGHTLPGHNFYPPTVIVTGSGSVFVNNLPISRVNDATAPHSDPPHSDQHSAVITTGSGNVFAG